ncbi:type II secretion system protein [Janthinobacterium sp.]|uniref:type II secretion system protein n=1 Tax=Janthinobacterium sp. TaxID=1871054 RepID=UPI0025C291C1|nr:type II secretion system protein [Janthinobacterium sp.]NBV19440.1 type II secretion system protein [Janthinobacterium sp.]
MNKSLRNLKSGAQGGFTLIELVVVIVILGILAATAIPRFTDLSADARVAKMQAAAGAVRAGSAMYHAQWLVSGSPADGTTVAMEGKGVRGVAGYPAGTDDGIVVAAGGLSDYIFVSNGGVVTITPDTSHTACVLTYTQAVAAVAPATAATPPDINPNALTQANCR